VGGIRAVIVAVLRARPTGALEIDGAVNLQAATPGQAFLLAYTSGILWYAVRVIGFTTPCTSMVG